MRRSPACHRSKIALRFSAMKAKLRLAFPNEPPLKRRKLSPEEEKRYYKNWAAFMKKSHQQQVQK